MYFTLADRRIHCIFFLSLIFTLVLFSCKKKSINCGVECNNDEEQLFQTHFNETILSNGDYSNALFSGTDPDFSTLNSWEDFENHEKVGKVEINYEDGEDEQRLATIVTDPDSTGNSVLKFQIMEPHIKEGSLDKGRVQLDVNNNQCIREIYQTVRLKLHPDMAHLLNWDERISWLTIFEFWNNADWTKEKYPYRLTVNLFKDQEGPAEELRFHVKGEFKKNCRVCKWQDDWQQENTSFSIPFGEWMNIELYIKEGDMSTGRFYMAIVLEDGSKEVLFDITNRTQHEKESCPDGFTHFQPLKLYTGDELINYMSNSSKELSVFWDDWKFYINKTP